MALTVVATLIITHAMWFRPVALKLLQALCLMRIGVVVVVEPVPGSYFLVGQQLISLLGVVAGGLAGQGALEAQVVRAPQGVLQHITVCPLRAGQVTPYLLEAPPAVK